MGLLKDNEGQINQTITSISEGGKSIMYSKTRDTLEESLIASINQHVNEAIYRSVFNQGLVYVNQAFVKMFGYESIIEVLNNSALELYYDAKQRKELGNELVKTGSVINREIKFKRKDGSSFYGSLSSIKVVGDDGAIYFDGTIRDITAEKVAEEKLHYQYKMQKLLISISSKYINMPLDFIDQTVQSTLEELGDFLNVDRIHIYNYDFNKNECAVTYEWCAALVKSVLNDPKTIAIEPIIDIVNSHFEGKTVYVKDVDQMEEGISKLSLQARRTKSILTVPMMLENNCVGFVGIETTRSVREYTEEEIAAVRLFANMYVNITWRANNHIRLRKLLETTSIQNKRLKDFSQITSHNIRASVANLLALNEFIQEDPTNTEFLDSLDATIQKLNTSVDNINNLINFDRKNEIFIKKDCNVSASIANVLRHNRQAIAEKRIRIKNALPPELYIRAFIIYVDSIFHHLISNAIKFGVEGEAGDIEIDYYVKSDKLTVRIKDFGKGIDLKKYGNKLFKAGVRLDLSDRNSQGMGLFMCKYMTEEMGGKIEVESAPNVGTIFSVSFPLSETEKLLVEKDI